MRNAANAHLYAMQDRDPSGWEHREPTDADYAAHERWCVATYGQEAYNHYAKGGWDDSYREDW